MASCSQADLQLGGHVQIEHDGCRDDGGQGGSDTQAAASHQDQHGADQAHQKNNIHIQSPPGAPC